MPFPGLRPWAREHYLLLILLAFSLFPLFADLGGDYLWSDEGDTAVLGLSILQYGVPKAWDGVTFTDSDFGERVNDQLVMVSHPWLQYYMAAASFCFFGENAFAARFPFALTGFLTIPVIYFLVLRKSGDKRASLSACILLVLSVQFLLFSRQCRNYAPNMFLTCLLVLLFFDLRNLRKAVLFSVTAILLFHCNPSGLAPLAALGGLTLIYRPFREFRRWYWTSVPVIAGLTLPFMLLAHSGYQQNTTVLKDLGKFFPRLTQFIFESGSVSPIVGVLVLFVWASVKLYREQRTGSKGRLKLMNLFTPGKRDILVATAGIFVAYGILLTMTQSRVEMWQVGLRYAGPIIPLMAAVVGVLVSKVSGASMRLWTGIMLVLCVTTLGRITPLSFLHQQKVMFDESDFAAMHVPEGWVNKIFRTSLVSFARELWDENHGSVAHVCEYLKTNAAPGDVLITNYEWEPVYFHTRLPQGVKILPTYPFYQKALKHELPHYVTTVKDSRWVVWRWGWEGYRDYHFQVLYNSLVASGATLTKVASVPETGWENRANIHFHRFPGNDYKFGFHENTPNAEIFRVDWPWHHAKQQVSVPENP